MDEASLAAHSAANFLLPLAREFRSGHCNEQRRRYLFKVAKWAIREFEPYFIKLKISRAAQKEAALLGIDLNTVTWAKRNVIQLDGKKGFHYEHLIEVAAAAHELVLANSGDEVVEILLSQQVAWITIKEMTELAKEDKARRSAGGSRLRDKHTWLSTVTAAGIELTS